MGEWPEGGTGQMFELVGELSNQLDASEALVAPEVFASLRGRYSRVILCGMGGSAIAGDLVQPLLAQGVSLTVWRNYGLPGWVGPEDLVICSSYSGDTEETLSGAFRAAELGCQRVAVTSGGQMASLAAAAGFPAVLVPGGLPPRASLGLGMGCLVRILGALGLVASAGEEIGAAAGHLRQMAAGRLGPIGFHAEDDGEGNLPAAAMARLLKGKVPVIYTAERETVGPGMRLRAQLNENSKVPVLMAEFPELNHNDLVGWDLAADDRGRFVLLILRGVPDNNRIGKRVAVTRDLLAGEFPEIHEIRSTAATALARTMSLVQYGDYVSCHLAMERCVDPVPVDRIGRLKDALADRD